MFFSSTFLGFDDVKVRWTKQCSDSVVSNVQSANAHFTCSFRNTFYICCYARVWRDAFSHIQYFQLTKPFCVTFYLVMFICLLAAHISTAFLVHINSMVVHSIFPYFIRELATHTTNKRSYASVYSQNYWEPMSHEEILNTNNRSRCVSLSVSHSLASHRFGKREKNKWKV